MRSAFLCVVLLYLLDVLAANGENVGNCIGVVCGYRSTCNRMTSSCECGSGSIFKFTLHDPSGSNGIGVVYCLKSCSENDRCIAVGESCIHDDESNTDQCLCSTGYSRTWMSLGHCQANATTTTHSFQDNNNTTTNRPTLSSQDTSIAVESQFKSTSEEPNRGSTSEEPNRGSDNINTDNVPLYIGLGIACATLIVLLAVLFLFLRRRRNSQGDQNNHGKPGTVNDDRRDPSPPTETGDSANQEYTEIDDDLRIRDVSDYLELSNRSSQPTAEYIHAISGHEYLEPSCTPKYSALDDQHVISGHEYSEPSCTPKYSARDDQHVKDNYIDSAHEYLTLAIRQKNCATHYDIISKDNL